MSRYLFSTGLLACAALAVSGCSEKRADSGAAENAAPAVPGAADVAQPAEAAAAVADDSSCERPGPGCRLECPAGASQEDAKARGPGHQATACVGGDRRHGPYMEWYATGQKAAEGEYQDDKQVGSWTWWHESGSVARHGQFKEGVPDGTWTYFHPHPKGREPRAAEKVVFVGGKKNGDATLWDVDGKATKVTYRDNQIVADKKDPVPTDVAVTEKIANTALLKMLDGESGDRYKDPADVDQGTGLSFGDNKGSGSKKAAGSPSAERPVSRVNFDLGEIDGAVLDRTGAERRIRARYLRGIKACHIRVLNKDSKAKGLIAARFTVGPTGKVTEASVRGFNAELDACIKGLMKRWRFPAPKDSKGRPTVAKLALKLALKPGG